MQHMTATPKQAKTDTFAVFAQPDTPLEYEDFVLVGRIEVPRYTETSASGRKLTLNERLLVAVERAFDTHRDAPVEGEEYLVMTDMRDPFSFVTWDPDEAPEVQ